VDYTDIERKSPKMGKATAETKAFHWFKKKPTTAGTKYIVRTIKMLYLIPVTIVRKK